MAIGSGTMTARLGVTAGDLAWTRVGGIVRHRIRPVVPSLSLVFGEPNEGVHLPVASRLQVTPSVIRLPGGEARHE
jgi:hypothetical protein